MKKEHLLFVLILIAALGAALGLEGCGRSQEREDNKDAESASLGELSNEPKGNKNMKDTVYQFSVKTRDGRKRV